MSANKLALLRYKTIDLCLQNRMRQWTLDDLLSAVSEALYEFEGITGGVSRRTVQLDIQTMRSDKLGYNAPIIVQDKKYYAYDDPSYSITNLPLSSADLNKLSQAVALLKQFKGVGAMDEMAEVITRLEDNVFRQKHNGKSYIDFEKNELLKGLHHIDPIHSTLTRRRTLRVVYQSFKAKRADEFVFYPYLLKEYRNRWFVLGVRKDREKSVLVLALDRIVSLHEDTSEKFVAPDVFGIDVERYFDDVIGVSKTTKQRAQLIVLQISHQNAPYILTKPLHPTQKIMKEYDRSLIVSIRVVWNFELEREILGFGESIKVLSPRGLAAKIKWRLKTATENYDQ